MVPFRLFMEPVRGQYGRALRGVGGMSKNVFAGDYRAVDREIYPLAAVD